jgi:hypothetical protein
MQAAKVAGRALTRQQTAAAPDWLGLCPEGSVTGGIWAMRDDYRTRFAVLAECGYPGGVDPRVFPVDIDACVTVTPADAAVFDSLDQAVTAWREGRGDTARIARPEPVTDYSQLGFLVRCAASPNGPFPEMSRAVTPITCSASTAASTTSPTRWPCEATSGQARAARTVIMPPRPRS